MPSHAITARASPRHRTKAIRTEPIDIVELEGTIMKKTILLLIASLSVGFAAQAQAQGLTRAAVEQQLVQAEAQGQVPANGTNYPPNARAIARNKAAYAERHEDRPANAYGGVADTQTAH
jgi:hypothetical protein